MMAPMMATTSEAASARKKFITPVAVPIWCGATAFWMHTVESGNTEPTPVPISASAPITSQGDAVGRTARHDGGEDRQRHADDTAPACSGAGTSWRGRP